MKKAPEKFRLDKHHRLARKVSPVLIGDSSLGNNGFFIIPHPNIDDYTLSCMISDGGLLNDDQWEHVSITINCKDKPVKRCPTWAEMCFIKDLFWNDDETVMQLHPPKADHVNNHPYCLHLWKPVNKTIPVPPAIMVGLPGKTEKDFA
jgi:hypothetical protein